MDTTVTTSTAPADAAPDPAPGGWRKTWHGVRRRLIGGLLFILPIAITLLLIQWLYNALTLYLICPLARLVLWIIGQSKPDADLPDWVVNYLAPVLGVLLAILLVYALGFLVNTRLRQAVDWILLRVPGISYVYKSVGQVFQTLNQDRARKQPNRIVLIPFPHPGIKAPAIVTSSCRDLDTGKTILCVYVPTTPVPTSGYFLMVEEDEVVESIWTMEEALQAIISGGITAPPQVRFFGSAAWMARQADASKTPVAGQLATGTGNGGAA